MEDKKQGDGPRIEEVLEYVNSIIATLREPFLVLDKKLRVISANRSFYNTFKVIKKETLAEPLSELGDGQWNIPKLLVLLKEILPKDRTVEDYEVEHEFKQIGLRVMRLNACHLRVSREIAAIIAAEARGEEKNGDEGQEELILLAIEDITERKRLLEECTLSEERYRRAFDTSHDGLLLVNKTEGDILNSNAAAQKLLGYSPEEFLKKKFWGIGVVKDHKDFQEMMSTLEKDGVIHYEDAALKNKKGASIDTEVFLVDKAKVLQCNIRNITERMEADEAIKESEAKFKAIFNESTDGMILAEAGTRRFLMCNPKVCEMLGYTEEELMRMRVDDIHPEQDMPFVMNHFNRQAKGDIKLAAGLPVKRKDGSVFYADINTSLITLAGEKYILGSFRDITESKKIQDELNEKIQDLEQFSKIVVDRELKMEELEGKIRELEEKPKAGNK